MVCNYTPRDGIVGLGLIAQCVVTSHSSFQLLHVVQRGQAPLSDLQCTTSSEALLCGKAPTFRLLVWALDNQGNPLTSITYVVSENFVVATKRVKHAIKSDIPCVADHVSKLVHIGKATVDKLMDLRQVRSRVIRY